VKFPIITFHSLDDSGSVISMSPRRFARIIDELAAAGWRGCSVSEALAAWRAGGHRPRRVGLSFDDAYRNLLDEALPLLRDAGFSATVFVVAGRCGKDNRWPGQPSSIPRLELLDWRQLEQLLAAGWEVGSHGLDHLTLPALSRERAARELRDARDLLQQRLGCEVPLFAYPYGALDATVLDLARELYDGACGTRLALATTADLADPYELPRLDAYYLRGFSAIKAIDSMIGRGYLTLRRWARQARRRRRGGTATPARS
jgi:peptidoglycan/xylan/chitin deacetylase (PgdA/CDA1 family)